MKEKKTLFVYVPLSDNTDQIEALLQEINPYKKTWNINVISFLSGSRFDRYMILKICAIILNMACTDLILFTDIESNTKRVVHDIASTNNIPMMWMDCILDKTALRDYYVGKLKCAMRKKNREVFRNMLTKHTEGGVND